MGPSAWAVPLVQDGRPLAAIIIPAQPLPVESYAAKRAFSGQEGRRDEWMLKLGSLSDRFDRFWKNVTDEAVKIRLEVKVVSYVYDNYRKAYQAVKDFRAENAEYDQSNFAGLTGTERTWERGNR